MRIHSIASSSAGNSYVVDDGAVQLILEVGVRWQKILLDPHLDLARVGAVLVSHRHLDHARSIREAMRYGLDVYATQATFDGLCITGHRAHAIEPLVPFKVGTWEVLAFPTVHDVDGAVGFLLANKSGEKVCFLTDTAYSMYKFEGVTHWLLECNFSEEILDRNVEAGVVPRALRSRLRRSHMSLEVAKTLLRENDLSKTQAVHLIHLSSTNSDAELFKREIQQVVGCPVYVEEA